MTSAGWTAAVELVLPVDGAGLKIQAIDPVMQHDFIGHFDVALDQFGFRLFVAEAASSQLALVFSAVGGAFLGYFRLTLGHRCGHENLAAVTIGDDHPR